MALKRVEDTFTNTNGTLLSAHTSAAGHTWSQTIAVPGGNEATIQDNAAIFAGADGDRKRYQWSLIPPQHDYTLLMGDADSGVPNTYYHYGKMFARCTGTGENCGGYSLRVDVFLDGVLAKDRDWYLYRESDGVTGALLLASGWEDATVTITNEFFLRVTGSTIQAVKTSVLNGSETVLASVTDTTYPDRGRIQLEGKVRKTEGGVEAVQPTRVPHFGVIYQDVRPNDSAIAAASGGTFTPSRIGDQGTSFQHMPQFQIGVGGLIPIEGQLWPRGNFKG